jgi:hypothetical protein
LWQYHRIYNYHFGSLNVCNSEQAIKIESKRAQLRRCTGKQAMRKQAMRKQAIGAKSRPPLQDRI